MPSDVTGTGDYALVVGAGPSCGPHVRVLDALTLTELDSFFAYDAHFQGGVFGGGD
jgi:hypothetical protein